MPSTSYTRRDHAVRIAAVGETAEISLTTPEGESGRTNILRDAVDRAARGDDAGLRAALTPPLSSGGARPQWEPALARFRIGVGGRAWAAIAFESFLPPGGWLVRTSPVRCRVQQVPLAFPIRILETGVPAVVRDA